jgi:hypothetical protein
MTQLFFYDFKTAKRASVCQACKHTINAGQEKLVIDLHRKTRGGHTWLYIFCLRCSLDKIRHFKRELDDIEIMINEHIKDGGDTQWLKQ